MTKFLVLAPTRNAGLTKKKKNQTNFVGLKGDMHVPIMFFSKIYHL